MRSVEMSGTTDPNAQLDISKILDPQQEHFKDLRYLKVTRLNHTQHYHDLKRGLHFTVLRETWTQKVAINSSKKSE